MRPQSTAERIVRANGVELCTQPFGDPADPPVLLGMGTGASMLWWEEGFCRMLADCGRFVLRYDHRDTGRSVTYQPGRPGYTSADLVADAAGALDAYAIAAAHVVGVSAGGALAQLLALDHPDRVLSLVLISTSPATPGARGLPPPTEEFTRLVSTARVDWSDTESVIDYLVGLCQVGTRGRPLWRSHRGAGRLHTGQAPAQQANKTCSWSSSCHKVRPTPPVLGVAAAPGSRSRARPRPR
jgi:pimeloyl-ACP methyl ester carboxylesterase